MEEGEGPKNCLLGTQGGRSNFCTRVPNLNEHGINSYERKCCDYPPMYPEDQLPPPLCSIKHNGEIINWDPDQQEEEKITWDLAGINLNQSDLYNRLISPDGDGREECNYRGGRQHYSGEANVDLDRPTWCPSSDCNWVFNRDTRTQHDDPIIYSCNCIPKSR